MKTADSWDRTARSLIWGLPTLTQALAFGPCLSCVVGIPCLALCLAFIMLTWLSGSILGLPHHYRLAWWSLDCGWLWFLSLDLLCSSCPDTVRLCPLSVKPLSLPELLSPWVPAHIFLQSSSCCSPTMTCIVGFNFKNYRGIPGSMEELYIKWKHYSRGLISF